MNWNPRCSECFAFRECGGWTQPHEGIPLISCFDASSERADQFIDPARPRDFVQHLSEVDYFGPIHPRRFHVAPLHDFPEYVTLIQGGVRFHKPLAIDHAALNLVEVFHGDKKLKLSFGRRLLTAESLRKEWGLSAGTPLVLSGVAKDQDLERLWANFRVAEIPRQIAKLDISAVTAPNFTFWKNAPRLENLTNRRRTFRFAEALSELGVPVVPHLNATHPADWEWNYEFFREHPELSAVCMEFRTGNAAAVVRRQKILELRRLSDRLGRPLLPVAIGSTEAARELRTHFPKVLAIDSTPALKTIRRQQAGSNSEKKVFWRSEPMPPGQCMSVRFEGNYKMHRDYFERRLSQPLETRASIEFPEKPHKTSQDANQLPLGNLLLDAA